MKNRLHKVIHGADFSHFQELEIEGDKLVHLDTAARNVNTRWPEYDEVCIETHALDFHSHSSHDVPVTMVLRGHVRCCCAPPCHYHEDHDYSNGGAFKNARRYNMHMHHNSKKPHAPGEEYVESTIDLQTLRPIHGEAHQRVPNMVSRSEFAAEIREEAEAFELTADEIEAHLATVLSAKGAATAVLAGHSEEPEDYFWVAAFVILWERLLHAAYNKLTKDWPQRHSITQHKLHSKIYR